MNFDKIPNLIPRQKQTVDELFKVADKYIPNREVFSFGINEFDKATDGGVRGGELITVSGMTGSGKTTFCQWLSLNFDKIAVPSLWFSFEMNPYYLRDKFRKMGVNENLLAYSPIELISTELKFIEEEIKEGAEDFACKIIFIDHLHYLIPLQQSTNASLLIGGIIRELKKLAIKYDVIIFLIAHTKKIYQGEKLDLSSIRDSSLVSQESDYVFLVERLKKESGGALENKGTEWTNKTKITLAKNRRTGDLFYITCEFKNGKYIPITKLYD